MPNVDSMFSAESIFSVFSNGKRSVLRTILSFLSNFFEYLSGLNGCKKIYRRVSHHQDPLSFMNGVLTELDVAYIYNYQNKAKIPPKGSCLLIANHPFGIIEGVIMAEMLLKIRPDIKIMANFLLAEIPQIRNLFLSVDPFERSNSTGFNVRSIREAIRWVNEGGLLLIFPAGEVSHLNPLRREIADPPWKSAAATIIRHTKPEIVPIYFHGRNSLLFQIAGLIHPRLRTLLLVRELLKKQRQTLRFQIGNTISYQWISHYTDDDLLLDYLRWRTYVMGHKYRKGNTMKFPAFAASTIRRPKNLIEPLSSATYRRDIERLPSHQKLFKSGPFSVWEAKAWQIPHILVEIGRLRELSFRQAGEGTNKSIDIDNFDRYYVHLFIWNEETDEIIGAYRVGQTDKILAEHGREGLYTNTLFHSEPDFFQKLGPALELGRSFVRPEYQKNYAPLLLLWKGIGAYLLRNPQYRVLFGPVSISSNYSYLTRRLLATTLLKPRSVNELAQLVRPRRPAARQCIRVHGCKNLAPGLHFLDFKEVCSAVSDIEIGQKDVPVLLRHYWNLGGQLLGFNIDKSFNGVMDGLIVVDLLKTQHKILRRYMGEKGAKNFLACNTNTTNDDECNVRLASL